jgi:hypothetical protein
MTAPFCKDCRHCRTSFLDFVFFFFKRFEFAKCHAPQELKIDLVSGTLVPVNEWGSVNYCSVQRMFDSGCGPSGKWFEARK